jgi:hypothetical protein
MRYPNTRIIALVLACDFVIAKREGEVGIYREIETIACRGDRKGLPRMRHPVFHLGCRCMACRRAGTSRFTRQ